MIHRSRRPGARSPARRLANQLHWVSLCSCKCQHCFIRLSSNRTPVKQQPFDDYVQCHLHDVAGTRKQRNFGFGQRLWQRELGQRKLGRNGCKCEHNRVLQIVGSQIIPIKCYVHKTSQDPSSPVGAEAANNPAALTPGAGGFADSRDGWDNEEWGSLEEEPVRPVHVATARNPNSCVPLDFPTERRIRREDH